MPRDATTHLKRRFLTLLTLVVIGSPATAAAQQAYAPQTSQTASQEPWPRIAPAGAAAVQPVQRVTYQGPSSGPPGSLPPAAAGNPFQLPAQGPVANTWPLLQAESVALQFNPILRRSAARIDAARGNARQASLYPNPRFDTNNPQVFAANSSSFNVGFQQQIVVKGKLRLDTAAANEVVRQMEITLVQDRFNLLTAVRQQFYLVLAAQRRVEVLTEIRGIAMASVQAAEGRVQATEGTVSEVLLLQTELQRTEIALRNAQTVLDAGRRQLAAIIGRPDLPIDAVSGDLLSGFPEFDRNTLREFVISRNAQVQFARRDIDRNRILAQRARVEVFPNVTMGPAYSYTIPQTTNGQAFWFNMTFDIPTWNRNQGNIRSTQADIADSVASLGSLQNELLRQADDALGRYRAARQTEERYRTQILPTARRGAQLVKQGYLTGVLDISTYLQAQRSLTDASSEYVDALQDVWATAAEIANLLQLERFP